MASKPMLSVVDRSVALLVPNADDTASRRDGISAPVERLHRLHGTSLLQSASILLKLHASTYATSCTILHRFCHQVSLQKECVWSISMACTLLACKVEEEARTVRHIILVYARLYRRRRLILVDDTNIKRIISNPHIASSPLASTLSLKEKEAKLRQIGTLSPLGPVYDVWHTELVEMEQKVLRQLGFTLYWIPDVHAHKFILYFCRVLELDNYAVQQAWKHCNTSSRLDLSLRYSPQVIACAALLLLPGVTKLARCWWHNLIGPDHDGNLSQISNAILSCHDDDEAALASVAFLPSLSGTAFNDPESYLWSIAE